MGSKVIKEIGANVALAHPHKKIFCHTVLLLLEKKKKKRFLRDLHRLSSPGDYSIFSYVEE